MTKQYFVTSREGCPDCAGVGVVQHPVWAEYWKQNRNVYHEMSEADDLEWLSNNFPDYHHMPHNEEMNCTQCNGKGEIEKEMDLLDALTELGVVLSNFPDMAEVVTRSIERPTKRTVAISRDGVTTIFDAAWLNIMRTQDDGSMYGNNTQG